MNDTSIDPHDNPPPTDTVSLTDLHADKYNDPRAKITRRGVMIGLGVTLFGILGAAGSIYARRTHLDETTRFWGDETILALQLAERMQLMVPNDSDFKTVELTGTPGLAHLRHTLLESTHFDWATETEASVAELCGKQDSELPQCVQIRLTDPNGNRVGAIEIDIDLKNGWVGPSDGSRRVQATEWVQPKLRNYIATLLNVRQTRSDLRD